MSVADSDRSSKLGRHPSSKKSELIQRLIATNRREERDALDASESSVCVGDLRPSDACHLLKMGRYVSGSGGDSEEERGEEGLADAKNETILKKLNSREPVLEQSSPRNSSSKPTEQLACLPPKKRKCATHKFESPKEGTDPAPANVQQGDDEDEDVSESGVDTAYKLSSVLNDHTEKCGAFSTCWAVQALSSDQHLANLSSDSKATIKSEKARSSLLSSPMKLLMYLFSHGECQVEDETNVSFRSRNVTDILSSMRQDGGSESILANNALLLPPKLDLMLLPGMGETFSSASPANVSMESYRMKDKSRGWTEEEDKLIRELVEKYGEVFNLTLGDDMLRRYIVERSG
eukprot:752297-Hanusia_phi.AAC.1